MGPNSRRRSGKGKKNELEREAIAAEHALRLDRSDLFVHLFEIFNVLGHSIVLAFLYKPKPLALILLELSDILR